MQISASEVARLLAKQQVKTRKTGEPDLKFKEITLDELPESKVVEPTAAEIKMVAKVVDAAPDVREEVVMKLKERVEKGDYKVSGEEIADMMVRRMQADSIK
ncbi:MAG: flagellar biosynthesis anti-sigma factor FlgM [Armatimonadetes bacterium]|nr:flagellar biosynthesis anti-sigma factor FlgM [Armatimonadota bacterium]